MVVSLYEPSISSSNSKTTTISLSQKYHFFQKPNSLNLQIFSFQSASLTSSTLISPLPILHQRSIVQLLSLIVYIRASCAVVLELCHVLLFGGRVETDAMAASGKFDLSSGSPDRPLYTTGQRGSFMVSSLDRSSSFRENMENPVPSTLPSISRNGSAVTQGEAMNFFQCLRFDPKLVAAELKFHRQGEFKRFMNVALGILPDDSPAGSSKGKLLPSPLPEELKRVKASLRESSIKARERVKIVHDALSAFNKYFPSVPSRKRSRPDVLSSQRASILLSGDRSVLGPGAGKMGMQSHTITTVFDHEQQKSEERTKSVVPNKRTRTSLVDLKVDTRANALARPSAAMDRDREILRVGNSGAVQGEDRTLSIGVDGWEKSKMKKKRSGIKPDVSPTMASTQPIDVYREPKQGMQQRLVTDTRSRLNNDSHEFRPGIANIAVGTGKAVGASQQPSLGMRSSMPRTDQDNSSLLSDRRDRPSGSDKERVNVRVVNKTNGRDDSSSASPTSSMKMHASARAPRSGSNVAPKSSPVLHRPATPNEWEISHCSNKLPAALGASNRKRTPSARSSSPPVARWAGQRPQKISRTARRTNFVPIVPSSDDSPALDTMSDVAGNENASGSVKRMPSNSPQQIKVSSAALSESEDSAAIEIKSREKSKKSDEIDEKSGQNVQKMSTLLLSMRKNKLVSGEDIGDGVRRQGRTGRSFTSTRSLVPMTVEKRGGVGTAKQLRSARLGVDKTERAGRPPSRKLSDRKAYSRQKNPVGNAAADFLVGPDDEHGELFAAVKAVINTSQAFSSSFWRQMESYFGFMSDVHIAYLRQQVNLGSAAPTPLDIDCCGTAPDGNWLIKCERDTDFIPEVRSGEHFPETLSPETRGHNDITLCQRLIAALISEVDSEDICCSANKDLMCGSGLKTDAEFEANSLNYRASGDLQIDGCPAFNGYTMTASRISLDKRGYDKLENNIEAMINTGPISNFGHSENGILVDQESVPSLACSEFQYDIMSVDNRILLEIQNVGIFPEAVPDMASSVDEEIIEDIRRLEDRCQWQASKKKSLLGELLKFAMEKRELQEKELEQRAVDKLVEMTCEKYMTFWGPNASGGKSSSTKIAKKASLAFAKRTVERCHKFEVTGKSCFNETAYRDILLSEFSRVNEAQSADTTTEGESSKVYANTTSRAFEARVSASMGSQQSPMLTPQFGQNIDSQDIFSSDVLPPINYSMEQTSVREDTWSNRVNKREVLLDDVGCTISTSSVPSSIGNSLSRSTKGKRSERDRDGKGHNREVLSRNGNTKTGRPSLSNAKGERKSKAKPKQKTTQLSASVNGLLGKVSEQPKSGLHSVLKSHEVATSGDANGRERFGLDILGDSEAIDLSHQQLLGMDVLGVPDDLDGQGQDLGSWLNIDDEVLPDHDFMGLEIPMDDLSDLNMMV